LIPNIYNPQYSIVFKENNNFIRKGNIMQGPSIGEEKHRPESSNTAFSTVQEYGVREIDVTLIRPTNYTDDGYPIKTRFGVIRSNTLMQIGTLVHDIIKEPFFKNVKLSVRKIDEAI
jgi:hypothetical protein